MADEAPKIIEVAGQEVQITHPSKPYFTGAGLTKWDIVSYYLSVAEGALMGIRDRPIVLKRFVNGAEGEAFYQKRAPSNRPSWLRTVTLSFPSGRTAEEVVVDDAAGLAWIVNLGCLELHPHAIRSSDLEHPDELRIDLDPGPGVAFDDVRRVALVVKQLLDEHGLVGWPKTSGSRGLHVLVRVEPRWTFDEVRRAALAFSREVERRAPDLATSKWWKEERHGVFLDYNQNAKDRTTSSAYSVRPLPDARVSMPLGWDEIATVDPAAFTVRTAPERFATRGDAHAGIDQAVGSLESLLALASDHERAGMPDAPWPPHYAKRSSEPARVAPSRKRPATKTKAKKAQSSAESASDDSDGTSAAGEEASDADSVTEPKPRAKPKGRQSKMPLIVVARARQRDDAMAGLERWKERHAEAAQHLAADDVLVDSMRGRSTTWTRIRLNLRHVPEALRPSEEPPDPDEINPSGWHAASRDNLKS